MNPARTVFVSLAVNMTVFLVAGGRFEKLLAQLGVGNRNMQVATAEKIGTTIAAWAVLFVMLAVMADFPATAPLASGFALLLLLSTLLVYGVDAFGAIAATFNNGTVPPASSPGGGGGAKLT